LARFPQDGVHGLGVGWIEGQRDRAGVFVLGKHLFPGLAAVGRAIDAAFLIGAVGMAQNRHENAVGVFGVNDDG